MVFGIEIFQFMCYSAFIRQDSSASIYGVSPLFHYIKTTANERILPMEQKSNLENIPTEAHLWDAIFKKEIFFMPEQLFPLIQEIFGITYEKHTPIEPLATEYPVDHIKTHKISSIRSDVAVQIDLHNIFHFECEINKDQKISLRIFEYSTRIALNYHTSPHTLHFPRSALICLYDEKNRPKNLSLNLHFKGEMGYSYQIPVLYIQSYSLEDIKEKHLCILIPFLPLRFRRKLQSSKKELKLSKKELTSFYQEIILILDGEVKNNYLSAYDMKLILQLLRKSMIRVFYRSQLLLQEVLTMTEPVLKLEHEEYFYAMKKQKDKMLKIEHELYLRQQELSQKDNELSQKDCELSQKNEKIASMQDEIVFLKMQLQKFQKGH